MRHNTAAHETLVEPVEIVAYRDPDPTGVAAIHGDQL